MTKLTQMNSGLIEFFFEEDCQENDCQSVTLDQLWAIAHQQTRSTTIPACDAFLSIGLRLHNAKKPWQYYCTPQNVRTFASTGQDGVHYSFLQLSASAPPLSESPVVMTVPMNFDNQNIVVAENLYEFLCLGARTGYANLEVLADESRVESDEAIGALARDEFVRSLSKPQQLRLQILNDAFGLSPLTNLSDRMRTLQAPYLDRLQLGEIEQSQPQTGPWQKISQRRSPYRPFTWL